MERFIKGEIYIHVEPKDWPHVVRIAHIIGAKLGDDVRPRCAGYLLYITRNNLIHLYDWLSDADKAKYAIELRDLQPRNLSTMLGRFGVIDAYKRGSAAISVPRNYNLLLTALVDMGFALPEDGNRWLKYNAHRGGYMWYDTYKGAYRYTKSVAPYMRILVADTLVEAENSNSTINIPADKPGIEIKTDASKQPSRDLLVIANQGKTVNANYSFGNGFGFEATARCSPDDQYNFLTGAMLTLIRLSSPATAVRALDLYYHSKPENNKIKPFGGEA